VGGTGKCHGRDALREVRELGRRLGYLIGKDVDLGHDDADEGLCRGARRQSADKCREAQRADPLGRPF
jgi:hypothetical protein